MARKSLEPLKQTLVHVEIPGREGPSRPYMLALNLSTRTVSLLESQHIGPKMRLQAQFTRQEVSVLLPLLNSYPLYCPYATLLASFQKVEYGSPTEEEVGLCRSALLDAQEKGYWDQFLRPIRSVISRTRLKIQELDLSILPLEEIGYLLSHEGEVRSQ